MTIKFGNITKTLTGKIRLQRRSKMKTGVLRSSNPYLKISLTINHQLCTFLRDKTTSLPCPSHTLCISQEHTMRRRALGNIQELYNSCTISLIECFHPRGQHLCKFIGTKESVCIRKEFNSQRIGLGHQHGRHFIVLGHQYGRRDVM